MYVFKQKPPQNIKEIIIGPINDVSMHIYLASTSFKINIFKYVNLN